MQSFWMGGSFFPEFFFLNDVFSTLSFVECYETQARVLFCNHRYALFVNHLRMIQGGSVPASDEVRFWSLVQGTGVHDSWLDNHGLCACRRCLTFWLCVYGVITARVCSFLSWCCNEQKGSVCNRPFCCKVSCAYVCVCVDPCLWLCLRLWLAAPFVMLIVFYAYCSFVCTDLTKIP